MDSHQLIIDKENYCVKGNEFVPYIHPIYNSLKLYNHLAQFEQIIGFLRFLKTHFPQLDCIPPCSSSFGGFFDRQFKKYNLGLKEDNNLRISVGLILKEIPIVNDTNCYDIFLTDYTIDELPLSSKNNYVRYHWMNANLRIYIQKNLRILDFANSFTKVFKIGRDKTIVFDNLLHLVMIVKNAGSGFAHVLEKNLPYIDRWTILDTGSTDETIATIKTVLEGRVSGELYEEPFIDFGTTRNRALELAGDLCKFVIMLDDSYIIQGQLREFLMEIRSDQFADSFSVFIQSYDMQYASNRLLKSDRKLKYLFKIHEVVQDNDNINVIIPIEKVLIKDISSDYMQKRTRNRKEMDLKLLLESVSEDLDNPRHLYYIAQTYIGMENYLMAYRYFLERVYHHEDGFIQEKVDACFEAARIGQYKLGKSWEEVSQLYFKAYEMDPSRPDAIYFIGIHELIANKNLNSAFMFLKKAFELGYPIHTQYSLKPSLSFYFTPKLLGNSLCYEMGDFELGFKACQLYFNHISNAFSNTLEITTAEKVMMSSWMRIYSQLSRFKAYVALNSSPSSERITPTKPIICFIADGNWTPWNGRDLQSKGLGGSETFIVQLAKALHKIGDYNIVIFCKCSNEEDLDPDSGVQYFDIESKLFWFLQTHSIHSVIVSRFMEYLPLIYECEFVENIFLLLHDVMIEGTVIVRNTRLKKIICLSEWHKLNFLDAFPNMQDITIVFSHGIDIPKQIPVIRSNKSRFIYSSFANRGLLHLLEMWADILILNPDATLDLYCDIKHPWIIENYPSLSAKLDKLIRQPRIQYHGWCNNILLNQAWTDADIWLYPCVFPETFCRTALEAAISKTLVITNDLAALQETAQKERCLIVEGDASTKIWQKRVLELMQTMVFPTENSRLIDSYIEKNFQWAQELSWIKQSDKFNDNILGSSCLEYRNRFDWTLDAKLSNEFLLILKEQMDGFKQLKLLDLGTWTGTSIMSSVSYLKKNVCPNTIALCLLQENAPIDSFIYNLYTMELKDEVKYDSRKLCLAQKLLHLKDTYDLICIHREQMTSYLLAICGRILNSRGLLFLTNSSFTVSDNSFEILWENSGNILLRHISQNNHPH